MLANIMLCSADDYREFQKQDHSVSENIFDGEGHFKKSKEKDDMPHFRSVLGSGTPRINQLGASSTSASNISSSSLSSLSKNSFKATVALFTSTSTSLTISSLLVD